MVKITSRIIRFFEIDFNFLIVPLAFFYKVSFILRTNFAICSNLLLRRKIYQPLSFANKQYFYDTAFATKTFLTAVYDLYIVSLRKEILPEKSPVIIDIGANIGQFMFACKTLFPTAKVYSFEPDSDIFALLKKNAKNFEGVKTYNLALSNVKKKMKFYVSNEFSEWSSLKKIDNKEYKISTVDVDKGDNVLKAITKIDLLKIDVEGAEYDVVLGLIKMLEKTNYLLIEVSMERNNEDKGSSRLISLLLQNNFYIHHIGRIFTEGRGRKQGAVDILFKNNLMT
jgi:FkbM family methyltransferase